MRKTIVALLLLSFVNAINAQGLIQHNKPASSSADTPAKPKEEKPQKKDSPKKRQGEDRSAKPSPVKKISAKGESILAQLLPLMVKVEGGNFLMGAVDENDKDAQHDEKPSHLVKLSSFYICKYEVTQELWSTVMDSNPSYSKGKDNPVENVSWDDCLVFIKKLNALTGKAFRLPTEAEWEYAARGGADGFEGKFCGSDNVEECSWFRTNSEGHPHPVGSLKPNTLGLYDMSGNVQEWCSDTYGEYKDSRQVNPTGAKSGINKVVRGGGFNSRAKHCRNTCRSLQPQDVRDNSIGLRLVIDTLGK